MAGDPVRGEETRKRSYGVGTKSKLAGYQEKTDPHGDKKFDEVVSL